MREASAVALAKAFCQPLELVFVIHGNPLPCNPLGTLPINPVTLPPLGVVMLKLK